MLGFGLLSGPRLSWFTVNVHIAILHIKGYHFVNVGVRLQGLKLSIPMVLAVNDIVWKNYSGNA